MQPWSSKNGDDSEMRWKSMNWRKFHTQRRHATLDRNYCKTIIGFKYKSILRKGKRCLSCSAKGNNPVVIYQMPKSIVLQTNKRNRRLKKTNKQCYWVNLVAQQTNGLEGNIFKVRLLQNWNITFESCISAKYNNYQRWGTFQTQQTTKLPTAKGDVYHFANVMVSFSEDEAPDVALAWLYGCDHSSKTRSEW